jgi:hypothetical protein
MGDESRSAGKTWNWSPRTASHFVPCSAGSNKHSHVRSHDGDSGLRRARRDRCAQRLRWTLRPRARRAQSIPTVAPTHSVEKSNGQPYCDRSIRARSLSRRSKEAVRRRCSSHGTRTASVFRSKRMDSRRPMGVGVMGKWFIRNNRHRRHFQQRRKGKIGTIRILRKFRLPWRTLPAFASTAWCPHKR